MYSPALPNDTSVIAATIIAAALLHASFQLAVSVMTLLSGHALGQKRSHGRLLHLCLSYIGGNVFMLALLLLGLTYIVSALQYPSSTLWAAVALLGAATGIATLLLYYRQNGSRLWLPTAAADYLYERSKRTRRGFEAWALGMMTALAELPFIIAPLLFVAMVLHGYPDANRLSIGGSYVAIASLPLLLLFLLVGSGKRISHLEQWRARNRRFIQLMSGCGLLVISLYVFVMCGQGEPW